MTGRLITVEGGEGAGKSTNIGVIRRVLTEAGRPVVVTREPGGTPLAEDIRHLLLNVRDEAVDARAELLLLFAARAQHLAQVIRPALDRGDWVLCDRFTDATYAYQGGGRGLSSVLIAELERLVQGDLQPHLTLYLDVPGAVARSRIADRDPDRFEREDDGFFDRVRRAYLDRASRFDRFVVIDATADLVHVQAELEMAIRRFLESVDRP